MRAGRDAEALAQLVAEVNAARPQALKASFNLGHADFYPACSGKEGAAARLCERFGVPSADAGAIFDDDNDLAMASFVGGPRLVVGCACESVRNAIVNAPAGHFATTDDVLFAATERMLEAALAARA